MKWKIKSPSSDAEKNNENNCADQQNYADNSDHNVQPRLRRIMFLQFQNTLYTFDHTCWTYLAIGKIKQLGLLLQYNKLENVTFRWQRWHTKVIQHCRRARPPVAPVSLGFKHTQEAHASAYKFNNSATSVDPYCIITQNFSKISQCEELFVIEQIFPALNIGGRGMRKWFSEVSRLDYTTFGKDTYLSAALLKFVIFHIRCCISKL